MVWSLCAYQSQSHFSATRLTQHSVLERERASERRYRTNTLTQYFSIYSIYTKSRSYHFDFSFVLQTFYLLGVRQIWHSSAFLYHHIYIVYKCIEYVWRKRTRTFISWSCAWQQSVTKSSTTVQCGLYIGPGLIYACGWAKQYAFLDQTHHHWAFFEYYSIHTHTANTHNIHSIHGLWMGHTQLAEKVSSLCEQHNSRLAIRYERMITTEEKKIVRFNLTFNAYNYVKWFD